MAGRGLNGNCDDGRVTVKEDIGLIGVPRMSGTTLNGEAPHRELADHRRSLNDYVEVQSLIGGGVLKEELFAVVLSGLAGAFHAEDQRDSHVWPCDRHLPGKSATQGESDPIRNATMMRLEGLLE